MELMGGEMCGWGGAVDAKKKGDDHFVVIGHPKALTEYSLQRVDDWLAYMESIGMTLSTY
jgi:hypothetical protein